MSEEIKAVVLIIVRWALKFGSGFFASIGVSQGAIEEVALALVMFAVGVLISLLQRKKDLATPPVE